jgi:ornithine cyclodeaminase/alanine dehydrogenase-like protein (mu-crystallin family)
VLWIPDDVVASLLDPLKARDYVIRALHSQATGQAGLSTPRSLTMRPEGTGASYQAKGAYLADTGVAGFRLAGTPRKVAGQRGMRLLLLNDLVSARPLALLAEHTLYRMRVGAAMAVAVEWLRMSHARRLGVIGTGWLAQPTVVAIQATTPFDEIRVTSRSPINREAFCESMARAGVPGVRAVATLEAASDGADVIITLTDANEPLVRTEWCRPGTLLVSGGGRQECEDDAILGADKIFVDDWEQCVINGDIAALHRRGLIGPERIAGSLADLATGKVRGRESDHERIVAVPQGLTLLDVAFAYHVYQAAQAKGLGTSLPSL